MFLVSPVPAPPDALSCFLKFSRFAEFLAASSIDGADVADDAVCAVELFCLSGFKLLMKFWLKSLNGDMTYSLFELKSAFSAEFMPTAAPVTPTVGFLDFYFG